MLAGLYRVGEIYCFLLSVGTGYFDLYGQAVLEDHDPADEALALVRKTCEAMGKGNLTIRVKNGKEEYHINQKMCHDFLYKAMECGLKKCGLRNGDYAKYTVEHILRLLL